MNPYVEQVDAEIRVSAFAYSPMRNIPRLAKALHNRIFDVEQEACFLFFILTVVHDFFATRGLDVGARAFAHLFQLFVRYQTRVQRRHPMTPSYGTHPTNQISGILLAGEDVLRVHAGASVEAGCAVRLTGYG